MKQWSLKKLKPLLQDYTKIHVDDHGNITHLVQEAIGNQQEEVMLKTQQAWITYTEVEGQNWYGEALMRAAEYPYDAWELTEESACNYQNRVSGSHWVVYYPTGTTVYNDEETDNY